MHLYHAQCKLAQAQQQLQQFEKGTVSAREALDGFRAIAPQPGLEKPTGGVVVAAGAGQDPQRLPYAYGKR